MADNKTEQILVHLEYLREGMDGVNARLDVQNGRVRTAERAIAVLQWAMALIGSGTLAVFTAYLWSVLK